MSAPPLGEREAGDLVRFLGFDRPASEAGSLTEGQSLGRYRIGPLLGRGGMGTVYRASDEELRRDVAVKVLSGPVAGAVVERFQREARAAAIWISAPVAGLRPVRAARSARSKLRKPGSWTFPPPATVLVITSSNAPSTALTVALD